MQTPASRRADRRGFTLTELLVVIAIIAVLASLVSVGVMRALDTARQTRIATELNMLDTALKAYKDKFGDYPPCDLSRSNEAVIKRHVIRAFPRYYDTTQIYNDIKAIVDISNVGDRRPDRALVFWLGGFNPDPTRPFDNIGITFVAGDPAPRYTGLTKAQRKDVLFDFDTARMVALRNNDYPSYVPPGVKNNAPYVYLDAGTFKDPRYTTFNPFSWNCGDAGLPDAGWILPYWNDTNGDNVASNADTNPAGSEDFINADSFQLIAPGLDGKFGSTYAQNSNVRNTYRCFPVGTPLLNPTASLPAGKLRTGYDRGGADDDNVTNFLGGKVRLGDARP